MSLFEREFRDCLGRFPTGVALITVMDEGSARAMTINSFASVSLDPPLILWSLAKDSHRYDRFLNAENFAVNILAADQADLSAACARNDDLHASGGQWTLADNGAPLLSDAIARFECRRHAVMPGGDHEIILGEVLSADRPRNAEALVFVRSGYKQI